MHLGQECRSERFDINSNIFNVQFDVSIHTYLISMIGKLM